jgi:hypothetical protein
MIMDGRKQIVGKPCQIRLTRLFKTKHGDEAHPSSGRPERTQPSSGDSRPSCLRGKEAEGKQERHGFSKCGASRFDMLRISTLRLARFA